MTGATACLLCTAASCSIAINGICGQGCGLNHYFLDTTLQCTRCPAGMLNAYDPCAMDVSACWDPPPGLIFNKQKQGGDLIQACPDGFGPNATRNGCTPCAAGFFSVNASGCTPCAGGTFSMQYKSTVCSICQPGSHTPPLSPQCFLPASIAQGKCNSYANTYCMECNKGFFSAALRSTGCVVCSPGTYSLSFSSTVYNMSLASEGGGKGVIACTPCLAGTYSVNNGSDMPCQNQCNSAQGYYSNPGATACIYCFGGLTNADGSLCLGCGLGMYESTQKSGDRICVYCDKGRVNLHNNFGADYQTACLPCPNSTISYAPAPPASSDLWLLKGQYCVPAQLGYVASNDSMSEVACPPGTYRGASDLICLPCPPGTWSAGSSATCQLCPPGFYRGALLKDASMCYACDTGYISNISGAIECTRCPPGSVSTAGSISCRSCPANTQWISSAFGCSPCPSQQVSPPGALKCAACPAWTTIFNVGNTILIFSLSSAQQEQEIAARTCTVCPAGYYMMPYDTYYTCMKCPEGTQNPLAGANSSTACVACEAGYVPNSAGDACVTCPPGTMALSHGSSSCISCAPGSYSPDGIASCIQCPQGSFAGLLGVSACSNCSQGHFAASTGLSCCSSCTQGTYANETGQTACKNCDLSFFTSVQATTKCLPRKMQCREGEYIQVHLDQPYRDNECIMCQACLSSQYTVTTSTDTWTSLTFIQNMADGSIMGIPPNTCPGNTTSPGYRCLDNTWSAGQYIASQALAGMSLYPGLGGGGSSITTLPCTDLTFPLGTPSSISIAALLMDYVVGPVFQCFIGCKYGLDYAAVEAYVNESPDWKGQEAPYSNVFYPSAKIFAEKLCRPCPQTKCRWNRYRPQVVANDNSNNVSCGIPCMLMPAMCIDTDGSDNQGCTGNCQPPPANAVTIGGSSILNSNICPWSCNGGDGSKSGWHINEDATGCDPCDAGPFYCDENHVLVPPSQCFPYSRKADLCMYCGRVEGGTPLLWQQGSGTCLFKCNWGYYAVDGGSNCRPCTYLNNRVSCPVGTFRNVTHCNLHGQEPPCSPCSTPAADDNTTDIFLPVSFTTNGVPADLDNCSALCNVGYHTVLRSSSSQRTVVYVSDDDAATSSHFQPVSVHAISCVPCRFDDNVACHGMCPFGYFRNLSVAQDIMPGACVSCTVSTACNTGYYAPLCTGNGTADSACLKCSDSLLFIPNGTEKVREFVPYAALQSTWLSGLINASGSNGYACPTACVANRILSPDDGATCVSCSDWIATSRGCQAETLPSSQYDAQQPKPCDFIYSYWNATRGTMWWKSQYTPSFLQGFSNVHTNNNRAGICWACPLGTGMPTDATDLCMLLPGFGATNVGTVVQRMPIPAIGTELAIVMQEPRPFIPFFSFHDNNNRRLVSLDARQKKNTSTSLSHIHMHTKRALLQSVNEIHDNQQAMPFSQCTTGYYNDGSRNQCAACPSGSSTYGSSASGLDQCICLHGYYHNIPTNITTVITTTTTITNTNINQNSTGKKNILISSAACEPCPAETFRSLDTPPRKGCQPCPFNETTFGTTGNVVCACKAGMKRHQQQCVPCAAGKYCLPCCAGDAACPQDGVYELPCFSGATSPPGSIMIENCTCVSGQVTLKRPGSSSNNAAAAAAAAFAAEICGSISSTIYYCAKVPPNAVYDTALKRITCKKGWNASWSRDGNQVLVSCTLCGMGRYAIADPALPTSSGILHCLPCPTGTYSGILDAIGACTQCPFGLTTSTTRNMNISACGCSLPSVWDPAVKKCKGCPADQYPSSSQGCTACPANSILADTGATAATGCQCKPGFEKKQAIEGGTCIECPKGTYSPHASNGPCLPCPTGSTTASSGSTSVRRCGETAALCLDGYTFVGNGGCKLSSIILFAV